MIWCLNFSWGLFFGTDVMSCEPVLLYLASIALWKWIGNILLEPQYILCAKPCRWETNSIFKNTYMLIKTTYLGNFVSWINLHVGRTWVFFSGFLKVQTKWGGSVWLPRYEPWAFMKGNLESKAFSGKIFHIVIWRRDTFCLFILLHVTVSIQKFGCVFFKSNLWGTVTTVAEKIVNGDLHNSVHIYKIKSRNVAE